MFFDHSIKLRHDILMRDNSARLYVVQADLYERHEVSLAFRRSLNGLRNEP